MSDPSSSFGNHELTRALFGAQREANLLGAAEVAPVHVLLGHLHQRTGVARRLLAGITARAMREAVAPGFSPSESGQHPILPNAPDTDRALKFATAQMALSPFCLSTGDSQPSQVLSSVTGCFSSVTGDLFRRPRVIVPVSSVSASRYAILFCTLFLLVARHADVETVTKGNNAVHRIEECRTLQRCGRACRRCVGKADSQPKAKSGGAILSARLPPPRSSYRESARTF